MEHKDAYELDRIPFYFSRPDLRPPRLNIVTRNASSATPGYLFTSPSFTGAYRPDSGPYIFDTNGTLIWSGLDAVGGSGQNNIHDLHLCLYHDAPHLCFWQGGQRGTHGSGAGVVMDQRYRTVKTVQSRASRGGASVDFHEFKVLDNENDSNNNKVPEGVRVGGYHSSSSSSSSTALIITYQPHFIDGLWILDNCFEELSLDDDDGKNDSNTSRGPLFEWCASDHIDLVENPGRATFQAQGDGKIPDRPWDYVHMNSVDKAADGTGDYLVSARHLDTMYRISARDGSIVWRLGGPKSDFQLDDDLRFARQHDARFFPPLFRGGDNDGGPGLGSSNASATFVSFFNNANDGVTLKNNPSKGYLVQLDLESMTARKVAEIGTVPGKPFIESRGMGNLQQLPNGNTLLSFGRDGAMAEYTSLSSASDGQQEEEPVFFADMTSPLILQNQHQQQQPQQKQELPSAWTAFNYRTYLVPFSAWPSTHPLDQPPALWTYARTSTNIMTFYVSWNGATDVASYRFWVSDPHPRSLVSPPPAADFHVAGSWPKYGFETNFTIGSARPWAFAEALDAQGTSLANSSIVRTYVPRAEEAATCGKWHCFPELSASSLDGTVSISELLPLDGSAALSGNDGSKSNVSTMTPPVGNVEGTESISKLDQLAPILGLVEHVFALVGLGLCAWWIWTRVCQGCRRARGYERIEEKNLDGP